MRKVFMLSLLLVIPTIAHGKNYNPLTSLYNLEIRDIVVKGDYAYCAMGYGLLILDISDPENPGVVSNVYGRYKEIIGIVLDGDFAYAFTTKALYIFKITDPANPSYSKYFDLSSLSPDITVYDISARDSCLYISDVDAGRIRALDVKNHNNIHYTDSVLTSGSPRRSFIADTILYVATSNGLRLIGITDPEDIRIRGTYTDPTFMTDVSVNGNIACAASGGDSVVILNVSNPASPQHIKSFAKIGSPVLVDMNGEYCYVGDSAHGIDCYDISDSSKPIQKEHSAYYGNFDIEGDVMAIAWQEAQVICYDMSAPDVFGDMGRYYCGNFAKDKSITDGDFMYQAGQHFMIYDISNLVGGIKFLGGLYAKNAIDLSAIENYAFILCSDSVVKSIDITSKTDPEIVDSLKLSEKPENMKLIGDFLQITTDQSLITVDISDPTDLSIIDSIAHTHPFGSLTIEGTFMYHGAVNLYDISDPAHPTLLMDSLVMSFVQDTDVEDSILYGASAFVEPYMGALDRVKFTSPYTLEILPPFPTQNELTIVDVEGASAYVIDNLGNAMIIDVSNPYAPDSVETILSPSSINPFKDVEIQDEYVFLTSVLGVSVYAYGCYCGDINDDGAINIGDAVYAIQYIFSGGPPPPCMEAMDVNCDASYNIGDAVYLIIHIFQGGAPPCAGCE